MADFAHFSEVPPPLCRRPASRAKGTRPLKKNVKCLVEHKHYAKVVGWSLNPAVCVCVCGGGGLVAVDPLRCRCGLPGDTRRSLCFHSIQISNLQREGKVVTRDENFIPIPLPKQRGKVSFSAFYEGLCFKTDTRIEKRKSEVFSVETSFSPEIKIRLFCWEQRKRNGNYSSL